MVRARRELVRLPIAAILPLRMPMSPEYQGEPVPSMIRPRVMTMSKDGDCAMERGRATNERRSARKTGSRRIDVDWLMRILQVFPEALATGRRGCGRASG